MAGSDRPAKGSITIPGWVWTALIAGIIGPGGTAAVGALDHQAFAALKDIVATAGPHIGTVAALLLSVYLVREANSKCETRCVTLQAERDNAWHAYVRYLEGNGDGQRAVNESMLDEIREIRRRLEDRGV
jgi:hypothetical protein